MKMMAFSALLLPMGLLLAAPATAQQTTRPNDSLERTLSDFSSWVGTQVERATVATRRELPKISSEFDRQSRRLDQAVDSLSADGKREYKTQKTRYEQWAARQDSLEATARQQPTAAQAQDRMLGQKVNISRVRATDLPDLYLRLVETMRTEKKGWSQTEWVAASDVLSRLNARYEQVRTDLSLEERLRIRTLQGEFRTLEKARDVKDAIRE
ncbi:hypothetical protein CDA63_10310 [Hymenobacter amundsenii]|uniref:Conjugal transfer protein TraI n=2 Tax=Hymenobacter amundsenii TaxID=2006685 RepID=A0A2D0AFX2_9BACT|nr:hypothetical protein CDA63_10310 [Hymenobacter amundsenii]